MKRRPAVVYGTAAAIATAAATFAATNSDRHVIVHTPTVCHTHLIHGHTAADPHCTPGAFNPDVRQATITATICRPGWTATVRPSASYTNRLKVQSIAAYGYSDRNPKHYEEDHLVSLELGGAPADVRNLWAEPGASPNVKDREENDLHRQVCAGTLTLRAAQQRIIADWVGTGRNP